jgi:hypothetical protein
MSARAKKRHSTIAYLQTFDAGIDFVERNAGAPMERMFSKLYAERGIGRGDIIYVAYIDDSRRLNLVSRLQVRRMEPGYEDAEDVVVAEPGASTPMRLHRVIPPDITRELRFLVRNGWRLGQPVYLSKNTALSLEEDGRLRPQAVRTIRRLNARSAAMLEQIIRDTEPPTKDSPDA